MSLETEKTNSTPVAELECHALYNDQDADLILVSSDGKGFRVYSLIMKLASDVFKTMVDAGPSQDHNQKEPIHIQESAEVLENLLNIIYPNKLSLGASAPSFDLFREICHAAEKYEMAAALNALRIYLWSIPGAYPPLPVFALASRYEWSEELRHFSADTLPIDLQSAESIEELKGVPLSRVMKLMALQRSRRDLLVASLNLRRTHDSAKPYTISWSSVKSIASGCSHVAPDLDTPRWTVLKYRLSEEMELNSEGAALRQKAFWDQSEFDRIWLTTCSDCSGHRGLIDKERLKNSVLSVLDSLPRTI